MTSWRPLQDTIARRFALTIILAIVVTLGLTAIVVQLAGVWARPTAHEMGLLDRANDIVRMVEAVPSAQRSRVADAVANPIFRVNWYPEPSTVAEALNAAAGITSTTPVSGGEKARISGASVLSEAGFAMLSE